MFFLIAWSKPDLKVNEGARIPRLLAHTNTFDHVKVHAETARTRDDEVLQIVEREPLDAREVPFAEQHADRWDPPLAEPDACVS